MLLKNFVREISATDWVMYGLTVNATKELYMRSVDGQRP